ncbi:hypothetical protein BRN38_14185, partial [Xanthomonas oryzae pv. oryzae]
MSCGLAFQRGHRAPTPQQTTLHARIRHNAPRMHANSAPDFRLYPSNALDTLAALLAQELRRPMPGQPLLQPEVVLIPQVAM